MAVQCCSIAVRFQVRQGSLHPAVNEFAQKPPVAKTGGVLYQKSNGWGSPHPHVPTYLGITFPQFGQVHVAPLSGISRLLFTFSSA